MITIASLPIVALVNPIVGIILGLFAMTGSIILFTAISILIAGFLGILFIMGLFLFIGLLITGVGLAIGALLGSIVVAVILVVLFVLISIPLVTIFITSFTALRIFVWVYRIMIGWWSLWAFCIAILYYGINLLQFEEKPDNEYQNNTRFDNAQ